MNLFRLKEVHSSTYWVLVLINLLIISCESNPGEGEEAIVQYKEDILYRSELDAFTPPLFSADSNFIEDSIFYAEKYINKWLKDRIIAEQAHKVIVNLDEKIQAKLQHYKYSLINHEYAQWLLSRGLDEKVSEEEIRNYYEQNPDKFISRANYFRYFHIRTVQTNPYQQVAWMRSGNANDLQKLADWASQDTNIVMIKLDSSFVTSGTLKNVGEGYWNDITQIKPNAFLSYYTEVDKENLYNLFRMIDVIKVGDMKPLTLCREDIVRQILEKRKQILINEGQKELFEQANLNL